ncbi:MAG: mechanosensitive ion channel domain-containing protein [Thermoproteus sp.]
MDMEPLVLLIALGASVVSYIAARLGFSQLMEKLGVEVTAVFNAISVLLAVVIFLAVASFAYNVYALFLLMTTFLVLALVGLLIALRHLIEEYSAGVFISRVHGIHIGDYLQVGKTAGYIVAMRPTSLVIRDFKRNLVHIPYTKLIHESFHLVRVEEGHEIRVHMYMPYGSDVNRLRVELGHVASEFGVENFKIDVDHIGYRGVVLTARGILRDPRREEEVRYALLDRAYAFLATGKKQRGASGGP